jgi:catechol 2,3-dioxygenase-like lactoylglutathione lyase family enzyme
MIHHISLGTNDVERARRFYDAHYYGAFVFDPDGNKIEAVSYAAE